MDQIGNNRGGINGWITRKAIYGVVTKIVWSSCREIAIEQTDRRSKRVTACSRQFGERPTPTDKCPKRS